MNPFPERLWMVEGGDDVSPWKVGYTTEKPLEEEGTQEYVRLDLVQADIDLANKLAFLCGLPSEWCADLLFFLGEMVEQLRANSHKGYWGDEDIKYLSLRVCEDALELVRAPGYQAAVFEAADVANLAMMIAANANRERARGEGAT